MRLRRLAVLMVIMSMTTSAIGQSTPLSGHYFEMKSLYNPAAAGSDGTIKTLFDFRADSIGIDPALRYMSGLAEGGIDFGNFRVGAGVSIVNQDVKESKGFNAVVNLSLGYRFGGGILSIGLSPGLISKRVAIEDISNEYDDTSGEDNQETNPEVGIETAQRRVRCFDLGLGLFYQRRGLWLSLSISHITNPKYRYRKTGFVEDENYTNPYQTLEAARRTIYFGIGYNITLKKSLLDLEPSFFMSNNSFSTHYQATAMFNIRRLINVGMAYRSKKTGMIIAGIEYKGFHLTYSYEMGGKMAEDAKRYSAHEITAWYSMTIDLQKKKKYRQKSIRIL